MLKIDKEGSDDDSDGAFNKSSTTTTPRKGDQNDVNVITTPIHLNNMNNAIIGNANQTTPLQALPKVLSFN